MTSEDKSYFERREQQERALADRTEDGGARRIHLDMAERYRAKQTQESAPS